MFHERWPGARSLARRKAAKSKDIIFIKEYSCHSKTGRDRNDDHLVAVFICPKGIEASFLATWKTLRKSPSYAKLSS